MLKTQARKNLIYGGAGSGKSWEVAIFLLLNKAFQEPNSRFLITRTTRPALRDSCWQLMLDLLDSLELPYQTNLSSLTLTFPNGAKMLFVPLDDVNKLKSIERINYIWCEEATQISYHDYLQLDLRCRGDNPYGINQLFFTFNPDDENSFFKGITENPPDDTAVHHSTYKDNPFNTPEYIKTIEGLEEQDYAYFLIYSKGIWATPTGLIYNNWDIIKDEDWPQNFDEIIYGLDFGFQHYTALIELGIREMDVYVREVIYEQHLTTPMLIIEMDKEPRLREYLIYGDSAQPAAIEEIKQSGYLILPANKGQGSVIEGIRAVMAYKLHIHENSVKTQKSIKGYKWKTDRDGNILDREVPVKFNDDGCDATRYGLFTHSGANIPSILGVL